MPRINFFGKSLQTNEIIRAIAIAAVAVMAMSWFAAAARPSMPEPVSDGREGAGASLTVSIVTCFPGPEIYELYGHEAIRVRGEGIDSVWNFGMFDFREPNFVYRFVKGETDYLCVGYPFSYFLPEYVARGSKVVEQDLNLSQEEAERLLTLLREHTLPENRKYRYNYVKDNCATRILDQIEKASASRVNYPDSVAFPTFREEMRAYNANYPWYQFGIDLALGSGIDYRLHGREDMFVPVEMMRKAAATRFSDGRPLVAATRELNPGRGDAVLPPTPWWISPVPVCWAVMLCVAMFSFFSLRRTRLYSWVYAVWFTILGLAGTLVAFLVFISSHEATSPNALLLWLNPLQLAFTVGVIWRALRPLGVAMSYYNIVAMICMLAVWPFQRQSANPAFFPLMISTLILASTYAIIAYKVSYKNNRGVSNSPANAKRGTNAVRNNINNRRYNK